MLLIAFSSLILVAKGSMHKANKRQDNWHAQVPLLNINQAGSKYELSKEITPLQFNSLKILPKLISHSRVEKEAWEVHPECQEGLKPQYPLPHQHLTRVWESSLQADRGGIAIGQSHLGGCTFLFPTFVRNWWGICIKKAPSLIVGEIGIRFLNQRPSYKPSSNTFAHLCSAVFFRHQPCTSCRSEPSHNFHWCCTALCMHTGVYLECKLSMVRTVLMGLNIQMHCHSCVPKSMSVARWNKQKIYTFFLEPRWLFFLPTRSALLTRVNNFESASVHGDRAICSSAWVLCMKTK